MAAGAALGALLIRVSAAVALGLTAVLTAAVATMCALGPARPSEHRDGDRAGVSVRLSASPADARGNAVDSCVVTHIRPNFR